MRLKRADNTTIYPVILLVLLTLVLPCSVVLASAEDAATAASNASVSGEIRVRLNMLESAGIDKPANFSALAQIYKQRDYRPLWGDTNGVTIAAHQWLSVLSAAEQQGIRQIADTRLELEGRLNASRPDEVADLDLMLSDSFLQYAAILANGQFDRFEVDPDWHIEKAHVQPVKLMEQVARSDQPQQVYLSLLPSHRNYRALHSALLRYRWIAESGGWPKLDARGAWLQLGDKDKEIPRVRKILWTMGDLPGDALDSELFDNDLQRALRRFQSRHGLASDGVLGKATRAALAISVEQRIQQMQLNLERWHWLPRDLGDRYIMVNSAAFELEAYQTGSEPLSMRVIVGRRDRQTPVFMENMRYMIVNPYWHVPTLLARRDLIPALINQPDYFFKRGIRVLSGWSDDATELEPETVNWQQVLDTGHLPYKLQQDPGPLNALGRIKFMLPNRYNVYLHDTPGKHLFERDRRTFSSGCIRVEKPLELANFVLGNRQTPGTLADLQTLIDAGDTRTLRLPEPIPVYMVYQTAWVDRNGDVQFRDDVYRRDTGLLARLTENDSTLDGSLNVNKPSIAQAIDNLP